MHQPPVNRILVLLKTDGPRRASQIGDTLGITGEAARQQLVRLAEEGLVKPVGTPAKGRGRPSQIWQLTSEGDRRFPDGHAELTATLLTKMVDLLGPAALDAVIAARERETMARYLDEVADKPTLECRVEVLADIRRREGYMADCWREDDGSLMLVENHCPICAAATVCAGFCRSEIEMFRLVLSANVERTEHILFGARRCAYRITE